MKQDKKEDFEWAQRGCDLENIHKVIEAHKSQLLATPGTALCYRQARVILDEYMERCTPKSTKYDRTRYMRNKELLLAAEGSRDGK